MFSRCVFASLLAGAALALPASALAQQWPASPPPAKNMDRVPSGIPTPEVEELTPSQIERAQEPESASPAPKATAPKRAERERDRNNDKDKDRDREKPAIRHAEHTKAIACEGTFARTSSQLKLENTYKAQNVAFTQVEGSDGAKVMATVLFPNDLKQRLEIWWSDEEKRKDIYLIVINGRSTWVVPRGVRLGLTLAALEKINRKPFKLKGLDKDEGSQVSDWNGGVLAHLPGGCKVGVRMRADANVTASLREAAAGNKEFESTDGRIRAVNPTVAEIIVGY